jgi:uncharacterized protein (TIGR03089 family)
VQLRPPPSTGPRPTDVASALSAAAAQLGHRPAVTVLLPSGRQEQSVASLAQWAAKGAHLLELDLLLGPGDRLRLDAPPSWTTAAVALAAWWAGVTVAVDGEAEVTVVHAARPAPAAGEVLWLGDGIDGAPTEPTGGEAWVRAVQTFPDQPPVPRGRAEHAAAVAGDRTWTQAELLDRCDDADAGTLGIDVGAAEDEPTAAVDTVGLLADVALRPLVSQRPTVIVRGVARTAADGDRVRRWR